MLTDEQKTQFDHDGHILLRNIAEEDVIRKFREPIRHACERLNSESQKLEDRDTYGKAFLQTMNLWRHDDDVREFVFEKRFAHIAAGLLGVDRVRLYHDQALFKEPGGGPTPWHQDQYYWPLDTDRTVTMWMPLVDIDTEMGMLTFASGSYRGGVVDDLAISDESDAVLARYVQDNGFPVTRADEMKAGDATFHLGLTIHTAGENRSDKLREVMTIIYFADGARVTEPINEHQRADLETWLTPRRPGEIANGPLNPLLN
jgi:ectoine hydroxylase-related dioxygenase (phytanoyl-CoA dioxygenase family)